MCTSSCLLVSWWSQLPTASFFAMSSGAEDGYLATPRAWDSWKLTFFFLAKAWLSPGWATAFGLLPSWSFWTCPWCWPSPKKHSERCSTSAHRIWPTARGPLPRRCAFSKNRQNKKKCVQCVTNLEVMVLDTSLLDAIWSVGGRSRFPEQQKTIWDFVRDFPLPWVSQKSSKNTTARFRPLWLWCENSTPRICTKSQSFCAKAFGFKMVASQIYFCLQLGQVKLGKSCLNQVQHGLVSCHIWDFQHAVYGSPAVERLIDGKRSDGWWVSGTMLYCQST